ncbi:hypothetical protein JCM3765_000760 [Sporobolomyces pararoseus]
MLPQLDLSTLKPCTSLERKVLNESDLISWKQSLPFEWIQEYIKELIESTQVELVDQGEQGKSSQAIDQLRKFLDKVEQQVQDAQPLEPQNQKHAFSSFRSKLAVLATSLHLELLPSLLHADVLLPELQFHLLRSFGSQSRLDYGTGHELSFMFYLLSLRLTGILKNEDSKFVVEKILKKYWKICELVRKKFGLVIAGRRGVWKKDETIGRVWFDSNASEARVHPARSKSSSSLSSSSLYLNTSSTPLNLLRSLLLSSHHHHGPENNSPSSGTSTPNPYSFNISASSSSTSSSFPSPSPSTSPSPTHESRSDLYQLYLHTTLVPLPCLLHLRFGSLLPFSTYSISTSSSSATRKQDQVLVPLPSSMDSLPQTPSTTELSSQKQLYPPSSVTEGDKKDKGKEDEELEFLQNKREGFESTVAPWNLPKLSGLELEMSGTREEEEEEESGGMVRKSSLKRSGKSRLSISSSSSSAESIQ